MPRRSACEDHVEAILAMNAEGVDRKLIAERLGLPHHAVQAWLQRRKIPGKAHTERRVRLRVADLQPMIDAGQTQQAMADHFGVSISCVDRTLRRKGLQTARTGPRGADAHRQRWQGGRFLDKHGYVMVFVPLHPQAGQNAYVREHRLVMEVVLGRYLLPSEVVDHGDDHPRHNWPSNLTVYETNAEHLRATLTGRAKPTPRGSIPGAYGNTQKLPHCPGEPETLAQCPSEIRARLERFVALHRPTSEHQSLPRRSFLRSGAPRDPFAEPIAA